MSTNRKQHDPATTPLCVAPASPAQQRALRRISLRVVQQVRRCIGVERTPASAVELVHAENQHADLALRAAVAGAGPERPACTAGCASCCYQTVDVATIEAIHIAERIRRRDDAEELQHRVAKRVRERARRGPDASIPCAFLEADGRCGIYELRPMVCRGYNSADREDCERNRASGFRAPPSRFFKHHADIAVAIRTTLAMTTSQLGMHPHYVELNAGVLIALRDRGAARRWLHGSNAFAEAASDALRPATRRPAKRSRGLLAHAGA